jgi:hypothetical protein
MSDLDKVYPLYFLVKHSRTCSLWQLNPFIPPLQKRQFSSSSSREKGTEKIWNIYFLSSIILQLRQDSKLETIFAFNYWSCLMCCVLCACNLYHFMIFPQLSVFSFYCLQHSQCNVDLHIYVSWIHLGDLEVNREHGSTPTFEC